MPDIYTIDETKSTIKPDRMPAACETVSPKFLIESAEIREGFAVCWLWHAILFARINQGYILFQDGKMPDFDRDLREMRLFSPDRELYLYRAEKGFRYRLRIDGVGEPIPYFESRQMLWGTSGTVDGGWTTLSEKRGIRLTVPIEAHGVDEKRRVCLVTRNYLTTSEIGQVGIADSRFVNLLFGEN